MSRSAKIALYERFGRLTGHARRLLRRLASIQRCHIFFAERKLGFPKGCEDTSGAAFVGALADTLFEILQEPRLERLRLRGIRMPLLFEHFDKLPE